MTAKPAAAWPPIITAARVPRAVIWRDRILTIAMWLLLLYLMRRAVFLLWDEALELLGREEPAPEPPWTRWWERLQRYMDVAAVLGVWLLAWGIATLRRMRRYAGTPAPPPLPLTEQARRAGCNAADLAAWQEWRIVHVDVDANDRISATPGEPLPNVKRAASAQGG